MIIFLYNVLFLISLLIALPFLVIFLPRKELKMRLGLYDDGQDRGYLWFHCASVGEVNAVKPLLAEIKTKYPHIKILMTTMTVTGYENAGNTAVIDRATLLPFDMFLLYRQLIKRFMPVALIIVETELWFSLLYTCRLSKIPVGIVNGRISDKSFSNYLFLSRLVRKDFYHVSFAGAQSDEDRERYEHLGFRNVYNTQNLKFCTRLPDYDKQKTRAKWHIGDDDYVIVWGSSRDGEEEIISSLQRYLRKEIENLKFIVAPRHMKRLPEIKETLKKNRFRLLSETYNPKEKMIVIDTLGKLVEAYSIADLAVIGGSFVDHGGHNPLEPLNYEVPAIIGEYHSKCRDLVEKLLANQAIVISNRKELYNDILSLSKDREFAEKLGKAGKQTIMKNSCSVQMNLEHLEKFVPFRD